jgi:hypothetical protein
MADEQGGRTVVKGDVTGAFANIGGTQTFQSAVIVMQTQIAGSGADAAVKAQLEALVRRLGEALAAAPAEHQEEAEAVATTAQEAVTEATKPRPNAALLKSRLGTLKELAEAARSTLPAVAGLARDLWTALGQFTGQAPMG